MRGVVRIAAISLLLAGASPLALASSARADSGAVASDAAQWRGRYCPPTGCAPDPGASWAGILGFGLAVVAAARLGGRAR